MNKFIFFIAMLSLTVTACNQNDSNAVTTEKTDSLVTKSPDMLTGDSSITEAALADDSVFSDGSRPTSWEIAGISNPTRFKLFLKDLQALVAADNREAVASHIRYPLRGSVKTKEEFIANYDRIFTKRIKDAVANINFNQVFRNAQGAMTRGGELWFTQHGDQFRIIAVNSFEVE